MQIIVAKPPVYNQVAAQFDLKGKRPIFAWGDKIYYPNAPTIPPSLAKHLIVHEEVHQKQQKEFGSIESWWQKYLKDKKFRLEQEIPAYQAQYAFIKSTEGRAFRRKMLDFLATDLSSPMYGNLVSKAEALKLIENA